MLHKLTKTTIIIIIIEAKKNFNFLSIITYYNNIQQKIIAKMNVLHMDMNWILPYCRIRGWLFLKEDIYVCVCAQNEESYGNCINIPM